MAEDEEHVAVATEFELDDPADVELLFRRNYLTISRIETLTGTKINFSEDPATCSVQIEGEAQGQVRAEILLRTALEDCEGEPFLSQGFLDDTADFSTLVPLPKEGKEFVEANQKAVMRYLEDDWGVAVVVLTQEKALIKGKEVVAHLAIFGGMRVRIGARLRVLGMLDAKLDGWCSKWMPHPEDEDTEGADGWGICTLKLKPDEMKVAYGKKGANRRKISRASLSLVEFIGCWVFFAGPRKNRHLARNYMEIIILNLCEKQQMKIDEARNGLDCTLLEVPKECVGMVTGGARASINRSEDDYGCLCFFLDGKNGDRPVMAIFGPPTNRLGAELRAISAIVHKKPTWDGFPSAGMCEKEYGFDSLSMTKDENGYILGKEGSVRKKLARSSGSIIEVLPGLCCVAGNKPERERGIRFVKYLLSQRGGKGSSNSQSMDEYSTKDVLSIETTANNDQILLCTRHLRGIESGTGTFVFTTEVQGKIHVVIAGADPERRQRAYLECLSLTREFEKALAGGYNDLDFGVYRMVRKDWHTGLVRGIDNFEYRNAIVPWSQEDSVWEGMDLQLDNPAWSGLENVSDKSGQQVERYACRRGEAGVEAAGGDPFETLPKPLLIELGFLEEDPLPGRPGPEGGRFDGPGRDGPGGPGGRFDGPGRFDRFDGPGRDRDRFDGGRFGGRGGGGRMDGPPGDFRRDDRRMDGPPGKRPRW